MNYTLVNKFKLAPLLINKFAISSCPSLAAICKLEYPSFVVLSTFVLAFNNKLTISIFPKRVAKCKHVCASLAFISTNAP